MPDINIRQSVWNRIKSAAARQGRKPEALANRAIQEFLDRLTDEELISQSTKAARRAPLRLENTEKAIKAYRERKRLR